MNPLDSNKALVARYFAAIAANDLAALADLMDPRLRFRCAGGTGFEDSVVFDSPQALVDDIRVNVGRLYDPAIGIRPEVLEVVAEGNRVAAEVRIRGRSVVTGLAYDNLYVFLFWISEGRFVKIHENLDTAYAMKTLLGPAGVETGQYRNWLDRQQQA
jgi:ketosteroid isomerase-like protein